MATPNEKKECVLKQLEQKKLHAGNSKFSTFKHNSNYYKITFSVLAIYTQHEKVNFSKNAIKK